MAEAELINQLTRIESMTNVELRTELKQRGCSTSGNKKDLLAKLRTALQTEYAENQSSASYNDLPIPENIYSSAVSVTPIEPINTPERKTRTRSKKLSVDSQSNDISNSTSIQSEQTHLDTSTNDDNAEVIPIVSKGNEEKDIEKIGGELHSSSMDTSNNKSESVIKEISVSDEQQHVKTDEQNSAENVTNNHTENQNGTAELKPTTPVPEETVKEDGSTTTAKQSEKSPSENQPKTPIRPQTSSSSFIKCPNRSALNKVNLSMDLLKTFIPDINLLSESVVNDELDALLNDDEINPMNDSLTIGDLADQKPQASRTVVSADSSLRQNSVSFDGKNVLTDEPVRIKDATKTNEPPSQILYIRGLTRPFSLFQLKGLLSRYGTLVDGEFWLDKIKSQCFATYNTLEEAEDARQALDGCRWPSTNPKTLSVRFGRQDELKFSKTHDMQPETMSKDRIVQEKPSVTTSHRSPPSPVARESDKRKDDEEVRSGFLISEEEAPAKPNEAPSMSLDDYFRKTKAKPAIYWLPLTEEEVIKRTYRQEQRKAERDEEQRKRNFVENTGRSDFSPSKEKRKRSLSPSRRDRKRH